MVKIKIAGVALIGLGAVLIGYNFYNGMFTGTEFERPPLAVSGESTAGPVKLTPDMNPVRAMIRTSYKPSTFTSGIREGDTVREMRVEVSMLDPAGKTVWEDSVDYYFDQDANNRRTRNEMQYLRTFEVSDAGNYTFTSNVHVYRGSLNEVGLVLKQNAVKISVPIVVLGVILFLVGLIMASVDQIKQFLASNIRRAKLSRSEST